MASEKSSVASIIVESLYNAGVRIVFGIPGAKIDSIFNTLEDHPEIHLVVCRHEQNAAMMAQAVGRISGTPGVCIATSGPGAGNLTTGLLTATTEGDPVVALVGSVPRLLSTKHTHQSMQALDVLSPVTKMAVNIEVEDQAAETILAVFRNASTSPRGAAVVSIPMDVGAGKSLIKAFPAKAFPSPSLGPSSDALLQSVARMVENAKLPVLFLGMRASSVRVVTAVRKLLSKFPIPVVETFQAAGAIPKNFRHLFFGRVGLFRNQTGDRLLAKSDLILTVGYDPTEYNANQWNPNGDLNIVHVDFTPCDYEHYYRPHVELLGSIVENINYLTKEVKQVNSCVDSDFCKKLTHDFMVWQSRKELRRETGLVHPLHFISLLQEKVSSDTTVISDVGTVYIWLMRFFFAYEPRKLLCSNGQQTLGIGLPWAIGASLIQSPPCSQNVVSLSGDGGFMFSSQEMSTAVLQGCNITHFIWNDEAYNMVEFQEEMKYGRSSGIKLGGVDFVKFAESFGAKGFRISDSSELEKVMSEALAYKGMALVDVKIDYSGVAELAKELIPEQFN
ncbi:putative acetolactate synthase [Amylocarpus encephaloides]|uniref:Acetolactate synthase n=1 Tax=Amylocarpus encephaloides TaxID=45428 RepID=A0A9P7Y890_9HELO|nr:putative acetolactate synthase [Amylocarpus encephaloides]